MINKVVVNNFKKFEHLEFELQDHLVIAGPNNSGKTTLLQAIAAWSEIALQWTKRNSDLARDAYRNFSGTNLNSELFYSVPIADFDHLWKDKNVLDSASVYLHTDQWKIGFEFFYKEAELASIRPAKDVDENDLERYIDEPLIPIYIPPLSGVEIKEEPLESVAIPARLARAQPGSVLRNLLLTVSRDAEKWHKLQQVVRSFFGYELSPPSAGAEIYARYRHSAQGSWYDLSSAASGFLQVLAVYAALLYKEASVVLIDEPDAHLHILLQDKMYRDLCEHARQNSSQLVIATHSERIIDAADKEDLRLLAGELRKVSDKRKVKRTLYLENTEILLAETKRKILYVEGKTDIDILRAWASVLKHSLLQFLEKPFWRPTAEEEKHFVTSHFSSLQLIVPEFQGIELCDGDNKGSRTTSSSPKGMRRLFWDRYEIESYLIHPEAIARFVESANGKKAANQAEAFMKGYLPPALFETPFESYATLRQTKGKDILAEIMQEAGLILRENENYQIAAQMMKEEIHPEVVEKLDAITEHFQTLDTAP